MDGDDALPRIESTATPATPDCGSGRGEALILASWTLIGGLFMATVLHLGPGLWGGAGGPVIFGGLIVLVLLGNFTRARTRTRRPRHFGLAEGMAALWLGMGGGIATQALSDDSGSGVPLGTAVIAAAVLTAPLFACSAWLAARGQWTRVMQAYDTATATPGAAPGWLHAYQQASAELAAVIDGLLVTSVLFAPTGDLVVLFHRPGGSRYAWIYDSQHLPVGQTDRVEFARLSLLGDLVPPTRWVHALGREDLAPWATQFGDVLWGGKADQPRNPAS